MDADDSPREASVHVPVWCVGHHLEDGDLSLERVVFDAELNNGYDMVGAQITNSTFRTRVEAALTNARLDSRWHPRLEGLDADEVNMEPGDHMGGVVAFASSWIEVDAADSLLAHVSKQALEMELAYAAFCGLAHVVIPGPRSRESASEYAQAVSNALSHGPYMQILVQIPMIEQDPAKMVADDDLSAWDTWHTIRSICKYHSQLAVALQLPSIPPSDIVTRRWFAEPIRILLTSSSAFCSNKTGYPVMTKVHQRLIGKYMKLRPSPYILLSDTDTAPSSRGTSNAPIRNDPQAYLVYIRYLQKSQPPQSTVERFASGYQDYLQAPLQPLAHNLESITYEVFEKDPVKYNQYEKAIELALRDRAPDSTTVVAVVGAGRGPLVTRARNAAKAVKRNIRLVCVEKNPNAYIHLLGKNRTEWANEVTVIKSDMRSWQPEFLVDIMISELLGSFADNELSPECLDGVQRVLNPHDGVMIPQSYSAHLTPIFSPKMHADIASRKSDPDAPETPYVVMFQAIDDLSPGHIEKVWDFHHPVDAAVLSIAAATGGGFVGLGDGGNDHNLRYKKTTFKVPNKGACHGLAGYFESVLYGNVEMSTRPDTIDAKSKDMISWFPIYFPLKTPIYVPDNAELDISIWRCYSERKVWYEWAVEGYVTLPGGKERIRVGASDLHSSKKNGCLM